VGRESLCLHNDLQYWLLDLGFDQLARENTDCIFFRKEDDNCLVIDTVICELKEKTAHVIPWPPVCRIKMFFRKAILLLLSILANMAHRCFIPENHLKNPLSWQMRARFFLLMIKIFLKNHTSAKLHAIFKKLTNVQ